MRGPLRKELAACFEKGFEERFPRFTQAFKERSGFTVWQWRPAPDLTLFVALSPAGDYDQFGVEVAWSEDGEFPWAANGQFRADSAKWRERICLIGAPPGSVDYYNLAPEWTAAVEANIKAYARGQVPPLAEDPPIQTCLARVAPLVHEAIQDLDLSAMPLLRKVIEYRGLIWDMDAVKPVEKRRREKPT